MDSAHKLELAGLEALATQGIDRQQIVPEPNTPIDRLERLRQQVTAGTYITSSGQIADSFLRAHKRISTSYDRKRKGEEPEPSDGGEVGKARL